SSRTAHDKCDLAAPGTRSRSRQARSDSRRRARGVHARGVRARFNGCRRRGSRRGQANHLSPLSIERGAGGGVGRGDVCARGAPAAAQLAACPGAVARTAPDARVRGGWPGKRPPLPRNCRGGRPDAWTWASFWEAGPRQVRAVIAQLWAEDHDAATAPIVAEQLVQLALGDAYQELVLGTGSP